MSTTPGGPYDGPDYLEGSSAGVDETRADNRKRLIALGALVAGGAVVAGGAWAATSFFATGAQPAEALPASTVAYLSVDLDPSGGQKIAAIRTLRKFPAFTDEIDLETDDDLRERLFDEVLKSSACEGIDFADDIEPWLGSRAAVAAVDLGEDEPAPVGVIQVTDAGRAEDGVAKLVETCGSETDGDAGGWVVEGDWMVVAETEDVAQQVVDAAGDGTLDADSGFQKWTGEAGDDGFVTAYVAKEAAQYASDLAPMGMLPGTGLLPQPADSATQLDEECFAEATTPEEMNECFTAPAESADEGSGEVPPELQQMINDFDGAAATVRFDGGAIEVEYAMSNYQQDLAGYVGDGAVDIVSGLPSDTVAAFGFALEEGWAEALLDYVKTLAPDEAASIDDGVAQFEEETGLAFPEDVETLLGEGVAVSLGSGIDPDAITNGGPGEIPLGIKVKGDADEIQAVLDKISDVAGPEAADYLTVTDADGYAVLALKDDYRSALEGDSGLGDGSTFSDVIDEDSQSVLYVNFDADDDWLVRLAQDDPEVSENLEPLSAFGISGRIDDDVVHGKVTLTTD